MSTKETSPTKLPISACIITLNEEKNIVGCIESLDFVSEIVVVDSFSTDLTERICRGLGVRFYSHPFAGHIEQKNVALGLATLPWVLALDADERVSREMKKEIITLFAPEPPLDVDGVRFCRTTWYLSRWIRHGRFYPDKQLRLFRRSKAKWAGNNPHDKIELAGRHIESSADILHFSYDDIAHHIKTMDRFSSIQAANLHRAGKARFLPLKIVGKSLWAVVDSYLLRRGFLDGVEGLIVAGFAGFSMFSRYSKLYELQIQDLKKQTRTSN